jgi:hypothetical protein
MMLRWRHLGGMVAAIPAAGIAGGTCVALSGEGLPFPVLVQAGLLAAFVHVGLFAMPLFALVLGIGVRPTLPRILVAALLIGAIPLTLITGFLAWWAGLAGLAGGFAFWVTAGPWEEE